jgi:hypothetical protein
MRMPQRRNNARLKRVRNRIGQRFEAKGGVDFLG